MAVYVITGASKGIGFEMIKQLSDDKQNLVIGLVRGKAATEKTVAEKLGDRSNIRILQADLESHASLKQAAAETKDIVGDRGVDYLVANGGMISTIDAYSPISALNDNIEETEKISAQQFHTNFIGNVHLFNLFIPLVLQGKAKKVIAISSGMGDLDFTNDLGVTVATLYGASKAALNFAVAKFNAEYKKDGVLFMSISPGLVATGNTAEATPEQMAGFADFAGKLAAYAPDFKGPITPEQSVKAVRSVWEKASIEGGYGGSFVSHLGNKKWV